MEWLATNSIALIALALSMLTAWIQAMKWLSTRHKVTVLGRSSTLAIPGLSGTTRNHTYVTLTIRNTGRAISVEDVRFIEVGGTDSGQGPTWGNPPTGVHKPFELLPSIITSGVLIPDGGSRSWVMSLSIPPFDRKPSAGVKFVAKAELSNGKTVESEPFWHSQSPHDGWDEMAFLGP